MKRVLTAYNLDGSPESALYARKVAMIADITGFDLAVYLQHVPTAVPISHICGHMVAGYLKASGKWSDGVRSETRCAFCRGTGVIHEKRIVSGAEYAFGEQCNRCRGRKICNEPTYNETFSVNSSAEIVRAMSMAVERETDIDWLPLAFGLMGIG